ncbi:phosphoglycerate kinase [Candidatus Kaiserbacteria bacterium]|nr:phosphoglycerate kinase [Candidatus Kaiserbacteria bacterium]MCB9811446.1 phosphoglycerate kinase [Candidatus Nomurabacteria bacterium]
MSKTTLPSIRDVAALSGKTVLLRASLNVPVKGGTVTNAFRIKRALLTINYLREQGAKVVVIGHIGREPEETLQPVHVELERAVGAKWCPSVTGEAVQAAVHSLQEGEVLLLENVRQDPREKAGDDSLAKELASVADLYVNDAFAASHRSHASLTGIPQFLPSYFGFNFLHEYEELSKAMEPQHPALFILGGAKFETKLPLVAKYAKQYDTVLIGGALANDVYKARGYNVGTSLVSDIDLRSEAILTKENIVVPADVVVDGPQGRRTVAATEVTEGESILDAGPQSIEDLLPVISSARTILWNGPLGNFEHGFAEQTEALARAIAASGAYSIIGGGDTIAAVEGLGIEEHFSFMSTAGGAMLTFLETGTLPAIEAVLARSN